MSKIQYPMTTAAVFDDVVFPIHLEGPHQIKSEVSKAIGWYCRWNNEEKAVVIANVLFSCWGAYLSHKEIMQEAA